MSALRNPLPEDGRNARKAERKPFAATVQCRRGLRREEVEVLDISASGARVRALLPLRVGHELWLKLPMLEAQEARVVWTDACESGCEFLRPLHPAVFEVVSRWR